METLKITVDNAGITRVWLDGGEVEHLQNVCFTAEAGKTPTLDVRTLVMKSEYSNERTVFENKAGDLRKYIPGIRQ